MVERYEAVYRSLMTGRVRLHSVEGRGGPALEPTVSARKAP